MALTFVSIATVTVGSGGAASIEFTNIPQTYTDLVIQVSARNTSSGAALRLRFNGSTTGYSDRYLEGDGASVSSGTSPFPGYAFVGAVTPSSATASTFASNYIYVPNYTSSNNKSISSDGVTENNATTAYTDLSASLWSNSAAITSIELTPNANTFAQYSTATLYGIKNTV